MFSADIGDITTFKGDVIINSLGVVTTDYGSVCQSIIDASHNTGELESIIARANDVYDIGEYFFTENFGLPVKAICHLITPHHDSDDQNLNVLIYSVKNILMSCRQLNYKKIGIPLIGTGANEYSKEEVFRALKSLCVAFCNYFTSMEVTIIIGDDKTNKNNDARLLLERDRRGGDFHYEETIKKFKKSTNLFKEFYEYNNELIIFDKQFFNKPSTAFDKKGKMNIEGIDSIRTYINNYIECKYDGDAYKKAKKNVHAYLGYGKNNPLVSGSNTFKTLGKTAEKTTFYKLCLAVRMNYQDASDFLNFFGFSFSHPGINETDDIMRQLLIRHTYGIVETNKVFGTKPLFK